MCHGSIALGDIIVAYNSEKDFNDMNVIHGGIWACNVQKMCGFIKNYTKSKHR